MSKEWKVGDDATRNGVVVHIVAGPDNDDNYCVMGETYAVVHTSALKPIKTIAEIERERLIKQMLKDAEADIERERVINQMFKDAEGRAIQSTFERLYIAGYRKVKPISLDDYHQIERMGYYPETYETLILNGHIIGVKEK